ncbi:hypothetical protein, partial [Aeromonas caviae]
RLSPFAFRLSPFAFRLSPFAFRLSPFAFMVMRLPHQRNTQPMAACFEERFGKAGTGIIFRLEVPPRALADHDDVCR